MKPLLPVFCRPLGYVILFVALMIPIVFWMQGLVTDRNLLFYKECSKLLMMLGALMILFALSKNESAETEKIRGNAARNAVFFTVLLLFGNMLYRVSQGDIASADTSSFLLYLIINILCQEFGMKKAMIDKMFKR